MRSEIRTEYRRKPGEGPELKLRTRRVGAIRKEMSISFFRCESGSGNSAGAAFKLWTPPVFWERRPKPCWEK